MTFWWFGWGRCWSLLLHNKLHWLVWFCACEKDWTNTIDFNTPVSIIIHFFADELLQEQKADLDQFLSSISDLQPDVTVSSEESVEVPMSEGKPYRPFQVSSLGSRSEPEGEHTQQSDRTCKICGGGQKPRHLVIVKDIGGQHTGSAERRDLQQCSMPIQNGLWSHWFGLISACTAPCGIAFNTALE